MRGPRFVVFIAVSWLLTGGTWTSAAARQDPDTGVERDAAVLAPLTVRGGRPPLGSTVFVAPVSRTPSPRLQDAAAQIHPEPKHTGLSALVRSTGSDFAAFPRRKSTWVILGIGAAAAGAAHPSDNRLNDDLLDADGLRKVLTPGKYLGYAWVQAGAAVSLYTIGRFAMEPETGTRTNKVSHLGFDLLRANILTQAFTYGIKYAVRRDRPTGECCAFPSGHASVTFATAAVLERHFGYRGSWPMFAVAGYVSASRLTDNRHYLSDVLFGSALGMAAGWTVVGRHGRDKFTLYPVPTRGGVALAGAWSPGPATRTGS